MTKCNCGYRHGTYRPILRYNDINITYRSNNGIKRNLQAVCVLFILLLVLRLINVVGNDKKLVRTHCQLNDLIFSIAILMARHMLLMAMGLE